MRKLLALIVVLAIIAGGVWLAAGRAAGPAIEVAKPATLIGQAGDLEVVVDTPGGTLTRLDITLEQGGAVHPLFSLPGDAQTKIAQESETRVRLSRPIGKRTLPALKAGKARVVVTAVRPVLFGYREAQATATRDVEVRLTPPRVGVVSPHHFINHGGSEVVVYRVQPANAESGVRVGDKVYPGFPASGAGVPGGDATLKVAFFALTYDQELNTPINVYARDEAGNEARASFDFRVSPSSSAAAASRSTTSSWARWCPASWTTRQRSRLRIRTTCCSRS